MNVTVIAVGTIKEGYLRDAIAEYSKRLSAYCKLSIVEIDEERLPQNPSDAQIANGMRKEGERIQKLIPNKSKVVTLCVEGKQQSSENLAGNIENWAIDGEGSLTFIIGGSYGLDPNIKMIGDKLSFSKMTFPHQLMRVILLEQIYRGFRIMHNEPYHK